MRKTCADLRRQTLPIHARARPLGRAWPCAAPRVIGRPDMRLNAGQNEGS